jgi:hypothetical protein
MAAMILKTCNIFKQEDEKGNGKKKYNLINNSHKSLMAEMLIKNMPLGLQISN